MWDDVDVATGWAIPQPDQEDVCNFEQEEYQWSICNLRASSYSHETTTWWRARAMDRWCWKLANAASLDGKACSKRQCVESPPVPCWSQKRPCHQGEWFVVMCIRWCSCLARITSPIYPLPKGPLVIKTAPPQFRWQWADIQPGGMKWSASSKPWPHCGVKIYWDQLHELWYSQEAWLPADRPPLFPHDTVQER